MIYLLPFRAPLSRSPFVSYLPQTIVTSVFRPLYLHLLGVVGFEPQAHILSEKSTRPVSAWRRCSDSFLSARTVQHIPTVLSLAHVLLFFRQSCMPRWR